MMRFLLTLLLLTFTFKTVQASLLTVKAQRYEPEVHYEVFRNAKPVGEYRLRFDHSSEQLAVEVEMLIATKIFGLFSYNYHYQATEVWRDDRLESLQVRMVTNGDESRVSAQRRGDRLDLVDTEGRVRTASPLLITTHHWLDDILTQPQVLNTLTGEVSEISAVQETEQLWMIDDQAVSVRGFRLGGDLQNTLSWYDQNGMWRGMSFAAKDGSTIDVRWRGARL